MKLIETFKYILKNKEKRYLIITISSVFLILIIFHIRWVLPLQTEIDVSTEKRGQKKIFIQKYKKQVERYKPELSSLRKKVKKLKEEREKWFSYQEPYKLAASIEQTLKPLIEQGELEINNYQVLGERKKGEFKEINIRFDLKAHIRGITELLTKIETLKGTYINEFSITKVRYGKQKYDLRLRLVCTRLVYG
jgi:predicted RNase H-like nuclease (RuvC/YqgF family)